MNAEAKRTKYCDKLTVKVAKNCCDETMILGELENIIDLVVDNTIQNIDKKYEEWK